MLSSTADRGDATLLGHLIGVLYVLPWVWKVGNVCGWKLQARTSPDTGIWMLYGGQAELLHSKEYITDVSQELLPSLCQS